MPAATQAPPRPSRSRDAILGVAWLRSRPDVFLTGSGNGLTRVNRVRFGPGGPITAAEADPKDAWLEGLTPRSCRGLASGEVVRETSWRDAMGEEPGAGECHIVSTVLSKFSSLTSVHINATDERLVCSGYGKEVSVYDVETGRLARTFKGAHTKHINIARFAHDSPHLLATSSFDKTVKVRLERLQRARGAAGLPPGERARRRIHHR